MNDNHLVASLKYQLTAYKDKLISAQKRIDELEQICTYFQDQSNSNTWNNNKSNNNVNNSNNNSNNNNNSNSLNQFIKAIELLTKLNNDNDDEDRNIDYILDEFQLLPTREMRALVHTIILGRLYEPLEYSIPRSIAESNKEWHLNIDYEILELIHDGCPSPSKHIPHRFRNVDFATVFRIVHEHKIYELWMEINTEPVDNSGRSYVMECVIPKCMPHPSIIRVCHSYRGDTEGFLEYFKLPALKYRIPHRTRFTVFEESDQSLAQFFDHTRFVPENVLLLLCLQITRALSRLEDGFVVHRDVNASSIFVSQHAEVRLANMSACLELATQQANGEWIPIVIDDISILEPVSDHAVPSQLSRAREQFRRGPRDRPTLDQAYYGYDIWCVGRMIILLLNYGKDENVKFRRQPVPARFSPYFKSLIQLMLLSEEQNRPSAKDCSLFLSVSLFGPAVEKYGRMSIDECQQWIFQQRVKLYYQKPVNSYEQLPIEDLLKREYLCSVTPESLSNVMNFYFQILEAT